ncbi:MAG: DEAD/DEAH box helicase [Pseudomonadota bacterium]
MIRPFADVLARKGYEFLTPVQDAVTQPQLAGRDLLVSAQTGSGKTVGFGLAIAPTLLGDAERFGPAGAPLALVVAPTRELALQVKRELTWLYADTGAVLASCVGGMDMRDERRALGRGAHIVVATPGRLRDHIMRASIDLSAIRSVVLDEADEMLDLGFREDLEFILEDTPQDRQTLLFSATVPKPIVALAQSYQSDAERISTISAQTQHADIEYHAMTVAPRDAEGAVINVLRYHEAPNAIVFCNTRAMVARLTARLSNRGFSVVALSGELTQSERTNALQSMRDGRARVCVATDVAARGIDLPKLDLVVHAELPSNHETLLHRSGRTGRAGRKGVSALVVVPSARKKAERLLKFAKLTARWGEAPSVTEIEAQDQARMLALEAWQSPITERERGAVDALLGQFTAEQIAAGFLRQYSERHTAPEHLDPVGANPVKARAPFGPSVWFSITQGRKQHASPRFLLPMVCKAGGLTKDDIGAIRVADEMSYVEIRADRAEAFVAALGEAMVIEGDKTVTRLDAPPKLAPGKPGGRARRDPDATGFAKSKSKRTDAPKRASRAPQTAKSPAPKAHRKGEGKGTPRKGPPQVAKGPKPPVGKPNSKKNRARAAANKA